MVIDAWRASNRIVISNKINTLHKTILVNSIFDPVCKLAPAPKERMQLARIDGLNDGAGDGAA